MSIKQRILAIKLSDKIKKNPSFAKELGVEVKVKTNEKQKESVKWANM